MLNAEDGRARVVVGGVSPQVDQGRFPVKRIMGEEVLVGADVFVDGHDAIAAVLLFASSDEHAVGSWSEVRMEPTANDRWQASFFVTALGLYFFTVEAWVDHFQTWRRDLEKKFKAGQEVGVELAAGAQFLQGALGKAREVGGEGVHDLERAAATLAPSAAVPTSAKIAVALSPRIASLMDHYTERAHRVRYSSELKVQVDRPLAQFGAWYELFPRSTAVEPGRHGTFKDCERWLSRIAEMGFDIVYLPPIHPIGRSYRKGKNNSLTSTENDPGSPWAIGSELGGHKAIHPELGTLEDFRRLVAKGKELKLEIALDVAFQCSPDHPYVREHPEWFKKRSDGSIQYAENPPKKYQDIYPLNFETEAWQSLWEELRSVFVFWLEQGVSVFRVDNPHTKSFRFWEWCLGELKQTHPGVIFLSEAFTRPKVMYYLAKLGFTQSYNYFPWRNTKHELTQYLTELTQTEVREFFRPNLWPNTPDILTQYLRYGGRAGFMVRLILAATLGSSYGVYGPAYETGEDRARDPESDEYLNSEKYEIRHWSLEPPGPISELMAKLNRIRRAYPALQSFGRLRFHEINNDQLIAYSKSTAARGDTIIVVVNLDPHRRQQGYLALPLEEWRLGPRDTYQLHDLLTDARYLWSGPRNFIELDPAFLPAHIFHLRRYVRTEQDFDYFM